MTAIPAHLLQEGAFPDHGYAKVLTMEEWCVAMLACFDRTRPSMFEKVERHLLTHEVFVLLEGLADLIICDGGNIPGEAFVRPMEYGKAYNVPPGVWHHVVMSEKALIILFEKANTSKENSEYYYFSSEKRDLIRMMFTI